MIEGKRLAQLVERIISDEVVGSSPTTYPLIFIMVSATYYEE